jgi:hypothetical protein
LGHRSKYRALIEAVLAEVTGYVAWRRWARRREAAPPVTAGPGAHPAAVVAVKAVHTAAWASIESCVAYVLWAGLAGRTDRRVGLAAGVVAGETLVFAGYGFRCPLRDLAMRYGAESGSVTDIYLPKWFAHNLPAIHAPLLVLMAYLHGRKLRGRSAEHATAGPAHHP